MNELHEVHALIVEIMQKMEADPEVTEEFKYGAYNIMYAVENLIKEKLEDYINKAVKQYEDSKAKA